MRELLKDLEMLVQEIALRDTEKIERYKIRTILESMEDTVSKMNPSAERLIFRVYISKLEEAIK